MAEKNPTRAEEVAEHLHETDSDHEAEADAVSPQDKNAASRKATRHRDHRFAHQVTQEPTKKSE